MDLNIRAPRDSRKRKIKEIAAGPPPTPQPAANFLTLQHQQFPSHISTDLHLNINGHVGQTSNRPTGSFNWQSSQATLNIGGHPSPPIQSKAIHTGQPAQSQAMLELLKPFKSFTALLTEDDSDSQDTNAMIQNHAEQLKRTIAEISCQHYHTFACAIAEKAAKKLKEKDMQITKVMVKNGELNQLVTHFRQEARAAQEKVKALENAVSSLKESLNEAGIEEDAESSFTDPGRGVQPINLACKSCDKKIATMLLWPCNHVALCTTCDAVVNVCPVCKMRKSMSMEIGLPI